MCYPGLCSLLGLVEMILFCNGYFRRARLSTDAAIPLTVPCHLRLIERLKSWEWVFDWADRFGMPLSLLTLVWCLVGFFS